MNEEGLRVLITGGAGFIGSNLTRKIVVYNDKLNRYYYRKTSQYSRFRLVPRPGPWYSIEHPLARTTLSVALPFEYQRPQGISSRC